MESNHQPFPLASEAAGAKPWLRPNLGIIRDAGGGGGGEGERLNCQSRLSRLPTHVCFTPATMGETTRKCP